MAAFDITGAILAEPTMEIVDPPDCAAGNDDMSSQLFTAIVIPEAKIARLRITPPFPWRWTITTSNGTQLPARAILDYTVRIWEPAPPSPVPDSLCPPTGDPVWDSTAVRQAARTIFDSSGTMTLPHWERKEYAFTVHRNQDGSLRIAFPPQLNEQCQVRTLIPPSSLFGDTTLVAFFHVHPAEADEMITCPDGQRFAYDPAPFNGLSGSDGDQGDMTMFIQMLSVRVGMTPRGIGMYVIDRNRVWLNPPFADPLPVNYFGQARYVPRQPPSCKWL